MIFIVIPIVSGFIGASIAKGRDRSALGWFAICFFLPLLGHILLAVLPSEAAPAATSTPVVAVAAPVRNTHAPVAAPIADAAPPRVEALFNLPPVSPAERWRYLVEYDPTLRDAAAQLAPLGPEAVDKLRDAFFALQDRTLVPNVVARIRERHSAAVSQRPPAAVAKPIALAEPDLPNLAAALSEPLRLTAPHEEPSLRSVAQFMPATAARLVPRHTTVTPHDLETAAYIETHRGVHLYRLADGRVYIDGHMAIVALDAARGLIDQAARPAALPVAPAIALHS